MIFPTVASGSLSPVEMMEIRAGSRRSSARAPARSIAAAVFAPFYQSLIWDADVYALAIAAMSLLLLWRHEGNIRKLLAGTESKLGQKAAHAAAPHATTNKHKGHHR